MITLNKEVKMEYIILNKTEIEALLVDLGNELTRAINKGCSHTQTADLEVKIQEYRRILKKGTPLAEKNKTLIKDLKKEVKRYKKAYQILISYFDSISEEEQDKVAKKLEKLNL